jgi:hypothetical protein
MRYIKLYENHKLYEYLPNFGVHSCMKELLAEPIPRRDLDRFTSLLSKYKETFISSHSLRYNILADSDLSSFINDFDYDLVGCIKDIGIINGKDGYYYVFLRLIQDIDPGSGYGYTTKDKYYKCDSYEGVESLIKDNSNNFFIKFES